jgi:hypothetical protein
VGTHRLYSELEFEVYHAPFTVTDFIAPSIWQVEAISRSVALQFRVQVEDDSGEIERAVVLYRPLASAIWSRCELSHSVATGWAEGSAAPVSGPIEYFAQAVDSTGNVALATDHGNPFHEVKVYRSIVYLPLVLRD